jgi:hypothetical protein
MLRTNHVHQLASAMVQAIHAALNGDMDIHAVLQLEQFKNHADHLSGRKSKATLIGEFADCISSDTVSWKQWQLYYRAISTSTITNDALFSQSVRFLFAAFLSIANTYTCMRLKVWAGAGCGQFLLRFGRTDSGNVCC